MRWLVLESFFCVFFVVFQFSQVMSQSSHVAHEYDCILSFPLTDLPFMHIMHVMQFWPGAHN